MSSLHPVSPGLPSDRLGLTRTLDYSRSAPGLRLVCTWSAVGLHSIFLWRSERQDVPHPVCTRSAGGGAPRMSMV